MNQQQIQTALAANAANQSAMEIAPKLRALYGVEAGSGYTESMIPLIAEYQVSIGDSPPSGVVRAATLARLAKQAYIEDFDCSSIWPASGADADTHFRDLLGRLALSPPLGRPLVLGIRGAYPHARVTHRMIHAMRYDDTFVLLRAGMTPHVFRGATHAYQTIAGGGAPDVDQDGKRDVGSIRPGRFVMSLRATKLPEFHITRPDGNGDLPAYRDTDHDGLISNAEADASVKATQGPQVIQGDGMIANGVLFHPGYGTIKPETQKHYSSIACQTAPVEELQLFKQTGTRFDYVLATARELAAAMAV